jgi:hypothetical protein
VLSLPAAAQLSPGPLSRAHRALGGPAGCTQCHAVSAGAAKFRCLDCHREIAVRLEQRRGLHAGYVPVGADSKACIHCHSEHNGEDFAVIHWDQRAFQHATTGFNLEGKHAALDCMQCHNTQRIVAAERSLLKNPAHSFLGLSRTCTSCHEDKHKGQLGANCLQCHGEQTWKPRFDHAKTRYPLTGDHLQVRCESCHTPGPDGAIRYTGLRFDRCSACHSDPHKAAFAQQTCESCHSTGGWKQTSFVARFDHGKTGFPLLGKHLQVGCQSCHRAADFKTPIAHDTCASCHKPDPHGGQFVARAGGAACEGCHTVEGFRPAKFALAEHDRTGFPLRAAHATVACAKCHAPAGKATRFKVKFGQCLDCHADAHRAQFAAAPLLNRCEQCHDERSFHLTRFTLMRHDQGRFPLTGAHRAVACMECHKPRGKLEVAAYHFDSLNCTTCHEDPHKGQFAARMLRIAADGKAAGCEACHSTKAWNDLVRFDHGSTKFALAGAHRAVACESCHRPPNLERKLLAVDFRAAPSQCEECHADPHGAQFAGAGRVTRCAECHTAMKWRPSLIDHEKFAFSLKGAHENVACKRCHVLRREIEGEQVLFYKPTPVRCDVCHGNGAVAGGS